MRQVSFANAIHKGGALLRSNSSRQSCQTTAMLERISRTVRDGLLKRIGFFGRREHAREGRFVPSLYADAHGKRTYKTYLPARGEGKPRPLVVMLHGCKQ